MSFLNYLLKHYKKDPTMKGEFTRYLRKMKQQDNNPGYPIGMNSSRKYPGWHDLFRRIFEREMSGPMLDTFEVLWREYEYNERVRKKMSLKGFEDMMCASSTFEGF